MDRKQWWGIQISRGDYFKKSHIRHTLKILLLSVCDFIFLYGWFFYFCICVQYSFCIFCIIDITWRLDIISIDWQLVSLFQIWTRTRTALKFVSCVLKLISSKLEIGPTLSREIQRQVWRGYYRDNFIPFALEIGTRRREEMGE